MNNVGLYVHIPFCISKCPYCNFYSVRYDEEIVSLYERALLRNLNNFQQNIMFDTLYFGGGTPILLYKTICKVIENISEKILPDAEITLEANPCCTDKNILSALKNSGVNRISFGVQSAVNTELKALGRRHNFDEACKAITDAFNVGITNISADIILGTPLQTKSSLNETIDKITQLPLKHISAYMLKVEKETPYGKMKLELPSDEEYAEMYLSSVDTLTRKGFKQYEISNFAIEGFESKHNIKYWNFDEYIGIGPSAHSFFDKKRFAVSSDINEFISSPVQNTHITDESPINFSDWIMLKLRMSKGIDYSEVYKKFKVKKNFFEDKFKRIPHRLINIREDGFNLTSEGFLVSNAIISIFI